MAGKRKSAALARRPATVEASEAIAPGASSKPLEVLIASHSHPQLSKGGAEIASYQLYSALKVRGGYDMWFLGCVRDQINHKLGATLSQPFSDREYIYSTGGFDWFKFANQDWNFPREFRALLKRIRPRILHFHHYINFGVETFLHVRRTLPDAKIIVTLHEYLAICHHFGQMITTKNRTLCYESSPMRCSGCFPEQSPSDFFLREQYIKRFFELVDHFVAPSAFLANRYIAWGVPKERISVIENVIPAPLAAPAVARPVEGPLRVGFFGQISFLKGINVLLEAAQILEEANERGIVFEIFGDYRGQPPDFQADFLARLAKAGRNVKFHGPYEQNRVDQLMQSVDLILIPSIWWENSPVVIQEALRNRRPIVCSDIGGMAEKVRDGTDGIHFPMGNSVALASLLLKLCTSPERLATLAISMSYPPPAEEIVLRHEELYKSLIQ
jgi:glycosyltransferase involved in cell wall biosynthesis